MGISSTFNLANSYEFNEDDEPLQLDYNQTSSSLEVEGTCVEQVVEWIEKKGIEMGEGSSVDRASELQFGPIIPFQKENNETSKTLDCDI